MGCGSSAVPAEPESPQASPPAPEEAPEEPADEEQQEGGAEPEEEPPDREDPEPVPPDELDRATPVIEEWVGAVQHTEAVREQASSQWKGEAHARAELRREEEEEKRAAAERAQKTAEDAQRAKEKKLEEARREAEEQERERRAEEATRERSREDTQMPVGQESSIPADRVSLLRQIFKALELDRAESVVTVADITLMANGAPLEYNDGKEMVQLLVDGLEGAGRCSWGQFVKVLTPVATAPTEQALIYLNQMLEIALWALARIRQVYPRKSTENNGNRRSGVCLQVYELHCCLTGSSVAGSKLTPRGLSNILSAQSPSSTEDELTTEAS